YSLAHYALSRRRGFPEPLSRPVGVALGRVQLPEVEVRGGDRRIDLQGATERLDGRVGLLQAPPCKPQRAPRASVARLALHEEREDARGAIRVVGLQARYRGGQGRLRRWGLSVGQCDEGQEGRDQRGD